MFVVTLILVVTFIEQINCLSSLGNGSLRNLKKIDEIVVSGPLIDFQISSSILSCKVAVFS